MKRASIIALFVAVLFLFPVLIHDGDPAIVESSGITPMRNTSTNAEGGTPYSGSGAARTATLKGLTTNETAGPLHIDSSSSGFGSVDLPAGWTGTNLRVDIPHSSMWVDRDPINNDLDDYHAERWLDVGDDDSTLQVPDDWTLIKQETSGIWHSDHPEHGVFEMNSDSNGVGGSRGWRFDAEYNTIVTLASTDEIYFSQMINIPRRALYSVHITFLYNVTANTDLQNQTYVFVRFGDHETKLYVHESGRTTNAWLVGEVVIPWSAYENITTPESLPFDIGIGTDLSGIQASAYDSYTYIDEIYMDFEVSPFPEQVNLKANNTAIGGMTSGSVSPYVPDDANRDCTDNPSTGIDLDGPTNDGKLYVAVTLTHETWESGFQFPLSIPQGAIITSAYIEVESATTTTNYFDMRLYASDEDTVTAFSSGTPHLEDRFDWVNTSVDWDVTGWAADTRYSSPDITRLVQKIISRSGWSTGNYICIMLEYMYSSTYDRWHDIKGTSGYNGADLARLFVNYMIPQEDTVFLSGSWSGSDTVTVEFTTNSSVDVMIEPSLYLNVTDTVDTLDNEQNTGTSFSVVNNSLAYWTANVLISPPSGVTDVNMSLSKASDWTFQNATDPDGDDRSSAVTASTTELTIPSTAVDTYGIWRFVLSTTNGATDLLMGIGAGSYGDTATFNVGDSAKFEGTAEIIGGSAMRLLLTDPSGQLFYASDDTTQGSGGDFEWLGITVTSSWDAGVWYADVNFNDTAGTSPTEVGTYQRTFTVKHDTSLTLQSPGDAVNDQLSVRVAGEMLYVEVQLVDDDNSQVVTGATVTMNWTVSGSPSDVTLEDYGTGDYGVALNTSDLGDAKRWRIEIDSYYQYYNNATTYFDLDLSHETSITYETPPSTPIGDDFTVKITVRDSFNDNPIPGATITSDRTIVGLPTDHANGSYTVTLDGSGLGVGSYVYQINATPSETYLLESTVNITFTLRNIYTAIYGVGGNSVSTPYEFDISMTITYNDTDHSFAGITGAGNSVENPVGITASVTEISDGAYSVSIDVGTASPGTYLINVILSKTNYHGATITIRLVISPHDTYIVVDFDSTIPWGVDSSFDVTWYDADAGGEVSSSLQNVTVVSATKGTQGPFVSLAFTLDVDGWTVGEYELNVSVYSSSANYGHAWTLVALTVRAHHTSVTVASGPITPWGSNSPVTVVFWDLDTDSEVLIANVTTDGVSFDAGVLGTQTFTIYNPTLATSTWDVAVVTVDLTVTCVDTNKYYDSASNSFSITIRAHFTSVTISANLLVPYGNDTPLTVVFWDLDTDSQVPIGNVSNLAFTPSGYPVQDFGTYSLILDTKSWSVGTTSINLTATCIESNKYYELAMHNFQVITRSLWTNLYHEPTDLIFPSGDDFVIVLRVNVSEPGTSYGFPVKSLTQDEFSVDPYSISIDTTDQSVGMYKLTIAWSNFGGGDYTITVHVDPNNQSHASAVLVISFTFRPARSFLSSPNYPQVTTPFETDVQITLNYTDVDRDLGIDGATIGNESINIYTVVDVGDGTYTLWIDVTGLSEGPHEFNLTANKGGYELKYLTFTVLIRVAYTYAIPTVGVLDIPVGNDPQFYVEYWDIDHDVPVEGANWVSDWDHALTVVYIGGEQRYQVTLPTLDTDALRQNYVVNITFYKGNYQNGTFTISITIRMHNTDFRLVSAVEPTSYIGVINISVYYGDLDNPEGIMSHYAEFRVKNATNDVAFTPYNDTALGSGFYILRISASQFPQGMQTFTVYVNWTAPVYTYQNRTLVATVNIIGVESSLTLLVASEPTPYLGNMSYIFFYSDVTGGLGIDNLTNHVHIYVSFQGESVDPSQITITDYSATQPGNYSIEFNTTVFGHTGLIYMNVYINWSKGVAPFYANRTDVISVRVLTRDTLVSIVPPTPTSYGENATFSFSYDDVTGSSSVSIEDDLALSISISLAEHALNYNSTTRLFTVSFDTSQFGVSLGQKPFTLDVKWAGAPFYTNRTGHTITVTVIARLTVLDYQSPAHTPYMNNVTFLLNWTDVTTALITGITGATVTLYDEGTPIPGMYYTWTWIQDGEYSVEFNTTYYTTPGIFDLEARLTVPESYILDISTERSFNVRYRVTLLSSEPTDKQPYNLSLQFVLNFQDLLTLEAIGNGSSHVTLELLNDSSWFYSIEWKPAFQNYEFIVETYNHPELVINTEYTFWLRMRYADLSPFYGPDDTYVTFELRQRTSSLDLEEPPDSTPYLDYAVFQVFYRDVASSVGIVIGIDDISLQKGVTPLVEGTDYLITNDGSGYYTISVNTTALDGLGITEVDVFATWIGGWPYHEAADMTVSIRVTKRETNVEITVPSLFTQYLDNVTFAFAYTDLLRGTAITSITASNIELWADGVLLLDTDFIMNQVGSAFFVSVNSTILSPNLVSNYNLTVKVDWNDATPPFYFDDTTIVKVKTITRLIAYSIDVVQDARLGENITFSFTLSDADSGALVVGALIGFDGQTVSLTRDVDFWIVEGLGSDLGKYTIHVDSLALFNIDRYRFDLDVSWNPSTQPFYANMTTIVLTASVREIETELILFEDQVSVLWTELANISVDYRNFFMGNLTPGATVTWDWPGVDQGSFTEVGSTGTYVVSINTALDDIGTKILIIEAQKTRFETAIIYVTIIVRSLPSAMIGINPSAAVISLDRGDAVDLIMYLEDVVNSAPISNLYVTTEVWAELEGQFFYLSYNGTLGYYTTTIPAGNATLLEVGSYDVRLAAVLLNYEPAAHSFKIMLEQSKTQLLLTGDTTEDMSRDFTEVVEFRVNLVLPDIGNTLFYNATVSWLISELGTNGNFTNMGNGTYFVVFNTTDIGFGIWPISFRARPWVNASDYASSATQITLNIKRIATTVEREASELDLVWGWNGNITFHFNGTFGLIPAATGAYTVGPYRDNAMDLGNGTYLVPFDTRALNPGASYILNIIFTKENYQEGPSSVRINVLYIPTELVLSIPDIYIDPLVTTQYVVPYGETLGIALFYNDTDSSEGYVGGLENANLTLNVISGPSIPIAKLFTIEELGGGYYRYLFDTTDISLLFVGSQPGPKDDHYTLILRLALANRTTALQEIRITIIPLPTRIEIVSVDTSLEYGQAGQMVVKFIDEWPGHAEGTLVTGANFTIDETTVLELLEILDTYEDPTRPGYYVIEYRGASILFGEDIGVSSVDITLSLPNVDDGELDAPLRVTVNPTETARTLNTVFMFGTPSLFIIVLLAIAYVKIWSVPKRLRQINSQVKSLSKGKIPKPIDEVKSRQEMIADLFNNTFQELELTRTAYQMPAESVEVDIPEMGELMIQLSILTRLTPTELDEFKDDVSKMRMSEQAAFVKEVIHQESIRVARRENKTPEEVVEEIAEEAKKRLAGEEAVDVPGIDLGIALDEPVILTPEDEKTEDVIAAITQEAEEAFIPEAEGMPPSSDRLSDYEIKELRKHLEQRGVPPHEIDTILEQAKSLPRDLVEELVKSLGGEEE